MSHRPPLMSFEQCDNKRPEALRALVNRPRMEGIVVFDDADRYGIAIAEIAGYLKDGKMKSKEDIVVGIETFPETLLKLFNGENFGKFVLQVAAE
jgi:NADPH-dependent curcumin reductase